MEPPFYSLRMHGLRAGHHLSGAERIVTADRVSGVGGELLRRALEHERGRADAVRLMVEQVDPGTMIHGRLPDLRTVAVADHEAGRRGAGELLVAAGVAPGAADAALAALAAGAGPEGTSMRGAMIVDAGSGRRLEPDPARGVRASRMDLTPTAERRLGRALAVAGLDNLHVREALVLAAKVLAAPGIVAELCWSDDPFYTAGYVASPAEGYVRFTHLKPVGEERGGRAFFWRPGGASLEATMEFLESTVMLIDAVGRIETPSGGMV